MEVLGIDIGGSGIKGAIVDTNNGTLLTPRKRIKTPDDSRPQQLTAILGELVDQFGWKGIVGVGFPSVVINGVIQTSANISSEWVGLNAADRFIEETGCPTWVVNDADAAGIAEVTFGDIALQKGVLLVLTLGTGIGSALFTNGHLVPNTELGHLNMGGKDAERRVSDAARQRKHLSWKAYASRLQAYLNLVETYLWLDWIILGGGISKQHEEFIKYLNTRARIVPAHFLNQAGIIGAAVYGGWQS